MSKLASVQRITKIEEIPNSQNIECSTVLGWQVVTKKDEYKVGDLCCYIQIDTVVPELPEYDFLRERKYRVRTIKLKGQLSQGLIVPLPKGRFKEGDDITDLMGIKKYEKPDNNPERFEKPRKPKSGIKKYIYILKYNFLFKYFPSLQRKQRSPFPKELVIITDEERIQNVPQTLQQYKGKEFVASYKLNGSSITIIHSKVFGKSKYRICSRRFELHDKKNDWYKVFNDTNFKEHILKLTRIYKTNDIIVQGECIGKFNVNHHGLTKDEIRLFNIYVNGKRLKQNEFAFICEEYEIPHCPVYTVLNLDFDMKQILEFAQLKDIINPKVDAEGLVFRCTEDNLSFKVINNKYLLKEK